MRNLVMGVVFLAVGIGAAWWGKGMLNEAKTSQNWPSVQGTIIESRLVRYKNTSGSGSKKRTTKRPTTMYKAQITYQYTVNGKKLTGDRVSMADYGSSSASDAKKVMKKYPVGATVKVFYDPDVPEDSVLEPGATLFSYVPFGAGVLFAIIGGLLILGGIFRVIKKIFILVMS